MKDTDINIQRTAHINTFYKELVNMYKKSKGYTTDFDSFPDKVQIALLDMIFNLGATTLRTTFTKFNTAIKSEKWDDAAKQCNRPDVSAARNSYVKGLFNDAHKAKKVKKP